MVARKPNCQKHDEYEWLCTDCRRDRRRSAGYSYYKPKTQLIDPDDYSHPESDVRVGA